MYSIIKINSWGAFKTIDNLIVGGTTITPIQYIIGIYWRCNHMITYKLHNNPITKSGLCIFPIRVFQI